MNPRYKWLILLALLVMLAILIIQIPYADIKLGQSEFRYNWTAAFILSQHENIYDPILVQQVQRAYTNIDARFAYITLSPPWVALLQIPFAFLPFATAALLWLMINVFSLVALMISLWQSFAKDISVAKHWWVGLLAVFSFSISLTALFLGQTTILVLVSLSAFLVFERNRRDEFAGIALVGLLIKPQMVYLTLPLLALYILRLRRWRIVLMAGLSMMLATLALFMLRNQWPSEYMNALVTGSALNWESANLGGIILALTGWNGGKFLGVVFLPLMIWIEWRYGTFDNLRLMVDISLLGSILTAPYGFSYDQVILLIPLLTLLRWIVAGDFSRIESTGIILLLVVADGFSFCERILTPSEAYFFRIPLIVALIYGYALWRRVMQRMADRSTNTLMLVEEHE